MVTMILAALLAAAPPLQQQTDTTLAVRPGGRLTVQVVSGSTVVRAWDRDAVRVRASHAPGLDVVVRQTRSGVTVESPPHRGPGGVTLEITVPRQYAVTVDGMNVGVNVQGVQGDVRIGTLEGPIVVRSVTGTVSLESVSGELTAEDITGRVSATTVNQSISLARVRGDVAVEAVNGGIILRGIDAARVTASTVNGLVEYEGSIREGGRYTLATHNGRITMSVPENASATISVHARSGRVESSFPVPLSGTRGERMSFRVGGGSAAIDLQSFNGTVRLVRPGGR
jgi:hypothetical protein